MKSIRAILLAVMITAASMVLSAPAMVMAGEEAKTEEALKVAVMGTRNLYEYPLWYAAEKKLFDIPIDILSFRKARIMDAALLTGEVDVLSNVFMVVRDPKKFTIVGVTAASALYAIISGENVDTSKLNGKIIAVRSCIRGRSIASLTQSVIKHWAAGLNLQLYCGPPHENPGTNGLYLVPIGNSAARIAALRKGDVDMAVVIVPKHLKALTPGYRLVAILRTPASNFIVRSGYLYDEVARRRITALMAGVQRAVRELSRNPQEAKAFIAKKSKMPNHTDRIYELGMELWSQTGVVPPETVLQWVKFFGEETPEGYQASYDFSAVPSIQK